MAGKNQHHVWQLLQRGFGEKRDKDHHIWVFEKGKTYKTITRKFGAEKYYYSHEGEAESDEAITDFENKIQSRVQDARAASHLNAIDGEFASTLVAHLEMRSMFIREEISRVGKLTFDTLNSWFSDKRIMQRLLQAYLDRHPDIIEREARKAGILDVETSTVRELVNLALPKLVEKNSHVFSLFSGALLQATENMSEMAKTSHLSTLVEDFSSVERRSLYKELSYLLVRTEDELVLPDTCLAVFKNNGVTPISQKSDRITDLIIPIQSKTYILGSKGEPVFRPVQSVNRALASCAFGAFIARNKLIGHEKLKTRIGKNAKLISSQDLRKVLSLEELIKNL